MDPRKYVLQLLTTLFAILLMQSPILPQGGPPEIRLPITPNSLPVGSGARAIGQGGAFTAVADDATAASWNPAGLTQLVRPEFSIVGSYITTLNDFSGDPMLSTLGRERTTRGDLNYLSIVYPMNIGSSERSFVVSLSYQQVLDSNMDLSFDWTSYLSSDLKLSGNVDFESQGGVGTLSPAFACQISRTLSLGAAFNFYADEFFGNYAWEQRSDFTGQVSYEKEDFSTTSEETERFRNFEAFNVTFGMLWRLWEEEEKRFSIGLTLDLPYEAHVDREAHWSGTHTHSSGQFAWSGSERSELEIDFPMSVTGGIAYSHSDALRFSLDVMWTDWSKFEQRNEAGIRTLPIGGVLAHEASIDDTISVRLGTEYRILKELKDKVLTFPLRGGLFYEPRPSLGAPADFIGFSLGTGITFADKIYDDSGLTYTRDRFSIDFAYQLRYGDNINGEDIGITGTKFDVTDQLFLISFIYYF